MTLNTKKAVPKDLIDSLLADYKKPDDLIGENPLLKAVNQAAWRACPRMSGAPWACKNAPVTNPGGNARNGKSKKTSRVKFGPAAH